MRRRRTGTDPDTESTCALPSPRPNLVGREEELATLRAEAGTGATVAVVGPPGVGKTALAVAAAHDLAAEFPDGCMAVDLRGMDEEPLTPRATLQRLLHRLGVPSSRTPKNESECSNLFRALVHERRMLLLLDNAADESQVRPLLVTGRGCLTLVTSRRMLVGLDRVRWLRLAPLKSENAVFLLADIVGADRVDAEPQSAAELTTLCAHLPLAIRILGNRLATRPHWSLRYLREKLEDERTRLRRLSAGDLRVRSAFELSYRRLDRETRSVFRRLAAVPGVDFGTEMAAVCTGVDRAEVDIFLEELTDAGLLQHATVPGRFQFHDLIRVFADDCLRSEEPSGEQELSRTRLLRHILDTACEAARLCAPDAQPTGAFSSREEAVAWLDLEAANWLPAQRRAARLGWHREVLDVGRAMHWYSDSRIYAMPWDQVFRLGVEAAQELGDPQEEAVLLNFLGWAQYVCMNQPRAGFETNTAALAIATETGDRREQAWANSYLAMELLRLGDPGEALEHAEQAAALSDDFGFFEIRVSAYNSYGRVLHSLGRFEEALGVHRRLYAQLIRRAGETSTAVQLLYRGFTLRCIGDCLTGLKEWRAAAETYQQARSLVSEGGMYSAEEEIALPEGRAWRMAGDHERARECLEKVAEYSAGPLFSKYRDQAVAELALLPEHG